MKKATRFLSILLCILLLAGTADTVLAEAVTLNIYVSGETDSADEYVKLDGRFRVWQNGEEIGEIQAGESITLPEGARIRIEPVTGFFEPGWDLDEAYKDISPVIASNRCFWIYLTHVDLARYVRKLWPDIERYDVDIKSKKQKK